MAAAGLPKALPGAAKDRSPGGALTLKTRDTTDGWHHHESTPARRVRIAGRKSGNTTCGATVRGHANTPTSASASYAARPTQDRHESDTAATTARKRRIDARIGSRGRPTHGPSTSDIASDAAGSSLAPQRASGIAGYRAPRRPKSSRAGRASCAAGHGQRGGQGRRADGSRRAIRARQGVGPNAKPKPSETGKPGVRLDKKRRRCAIRIACARGSNVGRPLRRVGWIIAIARRLARMPRAVA
jgi:ribosomal protein L44E